MPVSDADSLPMTLENHQAAAAWDQLVTASLAHSASTPDHLGEVLRLAPDFALDWATKGLFYLLLGRSELKPVAVEALANARAAARATGVYAGVYARVSQREAGYVEALAAYLAGHPSRAARILDRVLEGHPQDALAMKLIHAIRFVLGDRHGMLASMRPSTRRLGRQSGLVSPSSSDCPVGGIAAPSLAHQ